MSTKTSKLDRLDSELFNREFHDHFFRCTIAFAQNNLDLQRLADTLTKICSFFPYLNSILNEQTGGRV
jgi:hypothetical protein